MVHDGEARRIKHALLFVLKQHHYVVLRSDRLLQHAIIPILLDDICCFFTDHVNLYFMLVMG